MNEQMEYDYYEQQEEHGEMLAMLKTLQRMFCFPDEMSIQETVDTRMDCRDLIKKVEGNNE